MLTTPITINNNEINKVDILLKNKKINNAVTTNEMAVSIIISALTSVAYIVLT